MQKANIHFIIQYHLRSEIKCGSAMAKHLAREGVNSGMHRITAEVPTFYGGINFKDSLALALAQNSNGFKNKLRIFHNPSLKFHSASNSCIPEESVGFMFCLDFLWLLSCIKTRK